MSPLPQTLPISYPPRAHGGAHRTPCGKNAAHPCRLHAACPTGTCDGCLCLKDALACFLFRPASTPPDLPTLFARFWCVIGLGDGAACGWGSGMGLARGGMVRLTPRPRCRLCGVWVGGI